jgi:hypothetical protein
MTTYTLTVTEDQARAIQKACEFLARVRIGQVTEILTHLPFDKEHWIIDKFKFSDQLNEMFKPSCGLSENSSYGVGTFEDADILFDIYEVIRHRLAWDKAENEKLVNESGQRDWVKMMTVDYDEPMHWSKTQPLPEIKHEEA